MEVITLKLERRQLQMLKDQAKASGRSRAAILRELIDRHLGKPRPSLHDRAADLCGTVAGAKDTSTRSLKGYGRD